MFSEGSLDGSGGKWTEDVADFVGVSGGLAFSGVSFQSLVALNK